MAPQNDSRQPTHHGFAVNVKDHALYDAERGPLTDEQVQAIYDDVQIGFWEEAADIAREHGFRDVYSEGRMGGWAVPQPQPSPDSVGPRIEYVPEQDMDEWMRERFRPFERDMLALMSAARDAFLIRLAFEVERAEREPLERAHWAARDVETVDNGC